jgi:predicted HTH transcriptional regulator
MSNGSSNDEPLIRAWEKTVDVRQHFEDLSLRVRNFAITFHSLDGKDLCRIAMQPSPRPVFIKEGQFEHLYIRTGNSTRLLTTKEAIDCCKTRWK